MSLLDVVENFFSLGEGVSSIKQPVEKRLWSMVA